MKRASDIATRILDLRTALGMEQADFAALIGSERPGTVSDWETGRRPPRESSLRLIARAASIPLEVFEEGGPMPSAIVNRPAAALSPSRPAGDTSPSSPPPGGDAAVTPAGQLPAPLVEVVRVLAEEIGAAIAEVMRADELDGREHAAQIAEEVGRLLGEDHDSPRAWRLYELARRIRKGDL